MAGSLEDMFLHSKPARILVKLDDQSTENYASALSTEVDATYSHTVKILQRMEDMNLVSFQEVGRKKMVELTSRGEKLAVIISRLITELNR